MSHFAQARRYRKTLAFVKATIAPPARIIDIGTPNAFSEILSQEGYHVTNTSGEDLDESTASISQCSGNCTTAFEIFEHLLNPLGVLRAIPTDRLIASVPLSLWFAKAYRNRKDQWDQHYHEFEAWQFDWLLEKGGWEIVRSEKWISPVLVPGIRPLLRLLTPRYYIVEACRKK
ncbi:MAG: methyltransferase [Cytophagales bacterium]|nr:methyltransferase [Cytophagales bacterium]